MKRPLIDRKRQDSFHNFYVILNERFNREQVLYQLMEHGVQAVSHYEPLHLSEVGKSFLLNEKALPVTESISRRLIRLPFHHQLELVEQEYVIEMLCNVLRVG